MKQDLPDEFLMWMPFVCLIDHDAVDIGAPVDEGRKQEAALGSAGFIIAEQRAESTYDKLVDLLRLPLVFLVLRLYGDIVAPVKDPHGKRFFRLV